MLQFHLFVLGNNWFLGVHDLLSIFNSADQTFTLNNLLELIKTDFLNLGCVHCLLKESLHFVSLFLVGILIIASFLHEHFLVDLAGSVLNNWCII